MKIYIDENFPPQLAEGINILQKGCEPDINVLSIKKEFGEGVEDENWIPLVGEAKGAIITQDLNIHKTRNQRELYERFGCGIFFFKPPSKTGFAYWEMVEQIIKRWRTITKLTRTTKHPFAYRCTPRSDFEKI